MNKKIENLLYFRASDCFDSLQLAVETFEDYLKERLGAASPDYYKARNYLRDGEKFYQETFKEAKRLLGPLPPYSAAETEKWRTEYLSQHKILAVSQELSAMKDELLSDDYLNQWMSKEDIERLLLRNFDAQKMGKRKLPNIKVRILLDKLNELIAQARQLQKKAMEKFQAQG
jgi:hypothetical protein